MKNQNLKNVTVNHDSTIIQSGLSNLTVGSHTLVEMESLRNSYNRIIEEITEVQKLTRLMDYEKNAQIVNLQQEKNKKKAHFDLCSKLVKEWISRFPERDKKYANIIEAYYCDISNESSLKYIIAEMEGIDTDDDKAVDNIKTQNFHARIRRIEMNLIRKP